MRQKFLTLGLVLGCLLVGAASAAIAEQLDAARRRGFWHPRRNDVDGGLTMLRAEATA